MAFNSDKSLKKYSVGWIAAGCGLLLLAGWFAIPWAASGILGLGNITGMLLCGVLGLCCMAHTYVGGLVLRISGTRVGRVALWACGSLAAVSLVTCVVITGCMAHTCSQQCRSDDPTVLVLGCGVYGENPSIMLRERMDAALEYLNAHPDAHAVLCGGMGPGEDITEAECMYRYMTERGIDPSRLHLESASTSTAENLELGSDVIISEGLNPEVLIVTSEFHEYRAGLIADKLGIAHGALPAHTAWWLLPTFYVRELYAVVYEIMLR